MRAYIILVFVLCVGCAHNSDSADSQTPTIDSTQEETSVAESEDTASAPQDDGAFQHQYSDDLRTIAERLTSIDVRIENGEPVPCDTLLDHLPGSFEVFNDLYGGRIVTLGSGPNAPERFVSGIIAGSYTDHWSTFEEHRGCFQRRSFVQRLIVISSDGEWEADSVNFFQALVRQRLRNQPNTFCSVLQSIQQPTKVGFWYFLIDSPHSGEKNPTFARNIINNSCPSEIEAIEQAAEKHRKEGMQQ